MLARQQPDQHLLYSVRAEGSSASSRELQNRLEGVQLCLKQVSVCGECVLAAVPAFCPSIFLAVVAEEGVEAQSRSDGSHGLQERERVSAKLQFTWPQRIVSPLCFPSYRRNTRVCVRSRRDVFYIQPTRLLCVAEATVISNSLTSSCIERRLIACSQSCIRRNVCSGATVLSVSRQLVVYKYKSARTCAPHPNLYLLITYFKSLF